MKTYVVVAAVIFCSSLFNNSYASGTPLNMNEKLEEVVKFAPNELSMEQNQTEFVKVSFKINKLGQVEILEMNYSDEKIKLQLVRKLAEITVEQDIDLEKVYHYNFRFEKR